MQPRLLGSQLHDVTYGSSIAVDEHVRTFIGLQLRLLHQLRDTSAEGLQNIDGLGAPLDYFLIPMK